MDGKIEKLKFILIKGYFFFFFFLKELGREVLKEQVLYFIDKNKILEIKV